MKLSTSVIATAVAAALALSGTAVLAAPSLTQTPSQKAQEHRAAGGASSVNRGVNSGARSGNDAGSSVRQERSGGQGHAGSPGGQQSGRRDAQGGSRSERGASGRGGEGRGAQGRGGQQSGRRDAQGGSRGEGRGGQQQIPRR